MKLGNTIKTKTKNLLLIKIILVAQGSWFVWLYGSLKIKKSYCCDIWIISLFSKVPVDELKKRRKKKEPSLWNFGSKWTFIVTIFSTKSLVATIIVTSVK